MLPELNETSTRSEPPTPRGVSRPIRLSRLPRRVRQTVTLAEITLAVPVGFLGGAVVLNAIKEELPEERESRFSAFALGAAGYVALLLAV